MKFLAPLLTVIIVIIDQYSKYLAGKFLKPGESVTIIKDYFDFSLVMNPGMAFGLLSGMPSFVTNVIVISLSILAVVGFTYFYRVIFIGENYAGKISFGLIIGGAIGNLIDRIRIQAVIDFIDIHYKGYHWPAFNIADSAVTCAMLLLAWRILIKKEDR